MDSEDMPLAISLVERRNCGCSCSTMNGSFSGTCLRSVKRKFNELKGENQFTVPSLILPQNAHVEIGNECMALRETIFKKWQFLPLMHVAAFSCKASFICGLAAAYKLKLHG